MLSVYSVFFAPKNDPNLCEEDLSFGTFALAEQKHFPSSPSARAVFA